ncbi:MAG TPA: DUF4126 family protein [Solirubrobacteraceae bacterium]|jgi:hypothetical protein|nr:DUF4126 family protein [Solirubrobacteraceae bacterium]
MNTILYIAQGAGLAAAAGLRPFLPALLAGAIASDDLGLTHGLALDFTHTDFSFLQAVVFLLAVVVALGLTYVLARRQGSERFETGPLGSAVAGLGIGVGALLFAAVLAEHHDSLWIGLAAGVLCAGLAHLASSPLLARTRGRLAEGAARDALTVYVDAAALVLAALAIFAPPVSFLALILLARLLYGARRREGEKYAGLRILR